MEPVPSALLAPFFGNGRWFSKAWDEHPDLVICALVLAMLYGMYRYSKGPDR